jgi:hypothetical protein
MEALMLFSQEQERYLLENQKNQAIIEDLQKNLSQVVLPKFFVLLFQLLSLQSDEYWIMPSVFVEDSTYQSNFAPRSSIFFLEKQN